MLGLQLSDTKMHRFYLNYSLSKRIAPRFYFLQHLIEEHTAGRYRFVSMKKRHKTARQPQPATANGQSAANELDPDKLLTSTPGRLPRRLWWLEAGVLPPMEWYLNSSDEAFAENAGRPTVEYQDFVRKWRASPEAEQWTRH